MSRKRIECKPAEAAGPATDINSETSSTPKASSAKRKEPHQLNRRHRLKVNLHVKRKKHYHVALLGDSISKGVVWDEDTCRYRVIPDNYAALVGNRLKGSILNRARFGMTLGRAMAKSMKDLDAIDAKERPDMVLIEYGGNDCDFDWEAIARDPAAHHGPKTDLEVFRDLLRTLILRFSANGVLPVVMTLPPLDADRYFDWVSRNSPEAAANILAWLGTKNKIYWWQERYNAAILEVAAEMGVHVLDIRSAFLREPDYRNFLCADGIHPNAEGHRLMARRIGDWLERLCSRMLQVEGAKKPETEPVLSGTDD